MKRVLVIDDDTMIVSLLSEMLEEAGYEAIGASNGKIGIDLFHQHPADAVITDILMPEKEGLSTIFELKKDFPDIKIIAISGGGGGGTEDYLDAAKEFGAIKTFTKPVRQKELLSALEEVFKANSIISSTPKQINSKSNPEKILLISNQPDELHKLIYALEPMGHQLIQAHSNHEALALIASHDFSLAFLDHKLDMENFLTGKKILTIKKKTLPPLIFISDSNRGSITQNFLVGAVDYFYKPLEPEVIRRKVQVFIELHQQKQLMATQTKNIENSLQIQCTISDNLIKTAHELKQSKQQLEIVYSELERVNKVFQLFVPKPFLNRIQIQQSFSGGQYEQELFSILFCDIRNYTQHSEQMTPQENFNFLNDFFNTMAPAISKNQGFIDKFIGDAVMALFDQQQSADHALHAAVTMQRFLKKYNQKRNQQGLPEIQMGIGVNTGEVVVGALGSENRLNSTVIGDPVNLCSRLEELTKKFHVKIIISEYTFKKLKENNYHIREIDTVTVRGKTTPVVIYEVYDCDPLQLRKAKQRTQGLFAEGIKCYKQHQFSDALTAFHKCLDHCQDFIIFEYVKRCNYFKKYPPTTAVWNDTISDSHLLVDQSYRRRIPRHSLQTPLNIFENRDAPHFAGSCIDISIDGMKLMSSKYFEVDTILFIEAFLKKSNLEQFLLQDSEKLLGKVVWNRSLLQDDHQTWQMGLEIVTIEPGGESGFQKALEKIDIDQPKGS